MIDRFLKDAFGVLFMPVSEYCSAVWRSSADLHLELLDSVVSGASFLTGGMSECDIAYRQYVALLCILKKMRCNPMTLFMVLHLIRMGQWGLHAVLWSHICILYEPLVVHLYTIRASSMQNLAHRTTFILPSQCPSGTILLALYLMVWDWRVSRALSMCFYSPTQSLF